jgi:hypothetical protein
MMHWMLVLVRWGAATPRWASSQGCLQTLTPKGGRRCAALPPVPLRAALPGGWSQLVSAVGLLLRRWWRQLLLLLLRLLPLPPLLPPPPPLLPGLLLLRAVPSLLLAAAMPAPLHLHGALAAGRSRWFAVVRVLLRRLQ